MSSSFMPGDVQPLDRPVPIDNFSAVVGWDMRHQQPVISLGSSLWRFDHIKRVDFEQGVGDRFTEEQEKLILETKPQ